MFQVTSSDSTTTMHSQRPAIFVIFAFSVIGVIFGLFLDTAQVELTCAGGKCFLRHSSLGASKGFFGILRGSLQTISSTSYQRFESSQLIGAHIKTTYVTGKHGRRTYSYEVNLELKRTSLLKHSENNTGASVENVKLYKYSSLAAAEDMVVSIESALLHASVVSSTIKRLDSSIESGTTSSQHDLDSEVKREDPAYAKALVLSVRVDASSFDEILLILSAIAGFAIAVLAAHKERMVVDAAIGVIVVEHSTMLSTLRGWFENRSAGCHVALLVPASAVEGVDVSTHISRGRSNGGSAQVTRYGLELRLRNRRPFFLALGGTTTQRSEAEAAQEAVHRALQAARGVRSNLHSANAHSLSTVIPLESDLLCGGRNVLKGGGEPGGRCVVCLEKTARIAFAPCLHVCCCEDCGQEAALTTCPLCRRKISNRIGLYFS